MWWFRYSSLIYSFIHISDVIANWLPTKWPSNIEWFGRKTLSTHKALVIQYLFIIRLIMHVPCAMCHVFYENCRNCVRLIITIYRWLNQLYNSQRQTTMSMNIIVSILPIRCIDRNVLIVYATHFVVIHTLSSSWLHCMGHHTLVMRVRFAFHIMQTRSKHSRSAIDVDWSTERY